ncbi:MAG: SET domain-containing protein-lysine N-methyltransferase [Candidatus Manganitrophus sp. SA1]|nr:SET domain-containing protein-lysine N-methyltransferase [Candidatus Manganitrophus morganii]
MLVEPNEIVTEKITRQRTRPWFEIRSSQIQGSGAFALRPIPNGTRIIEYTGERITHAQADARYNDFEMERHHTYLFAVDEQTVIDATHEGNDARYINHSCDPNCESVVEEGRVFIDAIRDIAAGEELFFDYAYERDEEEDPDAEKRYACRCGTPHCRKTILAPPEEETESDDQQEG